MRRPRNVPAFLPHLIPLPLGEEAGPAASAVARIAERGWNVAGGNTPRNPAPRILAPRRGAGTSVSRQHSAAPAGAGMVLETDGPGVLPPAKIPQASGLKTRALAKPSGPRFTRGMKAERISNTFPQNDRDAIFALAEDYWNRISPCDRNAEHAFERDFQEARRLRYLPKELFVRVAKWKSVRNTRRYESNPDDKIRAQTTTAFQAVDATAINALRELNGVALRTASAILHWMRPDEFPILDYRVMAALGEPAPKSYEDVHFYIGIADRVKALSRKHSLSLRTMDRALWTWDKLRSGSSKSRCRTS